MPHVTQKWALLSFFLSFHASTLPSFFIFILPYLLSYSLSAASPLEHLTTCRILLFEYRLIKLHPLNDYPEREVTHLPPATTTLWLLYHVSATSRCLIAR